MGSFPVVKRSLSLVQACRSIKPHLSMGLALSKRANVCLRLPSGQGLREAQVKVLEIGPLHSFLGKGWSEPSRLGKVVTDSE
jgi:hypothetical protein